MAVFKSLTFDGVNSLDYGIYITGEAVYNAPERAVEMVNIPGKNGALALDQGRFENIEITYHAGCFADSQADFADKVMKFRNALASRYTYKRLTDEYHPDEYRLGLYKSGLEVDAVRYGTAGEFNIVFDCKPQRFLVDGDAELSPTDYSDVHTVSGDIVQIDNDGSFGVKSLTASLEPIQDLNGYDKPWAGGAGKNKLDTSNMSTNGQSGVTFSRASDGTITVGGKATATVYKTIGSFKTENGVSYTITGTPSGGASGKYRITVVGCGYDHGRGYTFTGDGNSHVISIDIYTGYPSSGTLTFKPMIRFASETDATYEPYTNICPISGHTECVTYVSPTTSETDAETYTTDLGRTVYGGTLDVVSGVLTVTDANIASYNGETLPSTWISDRDVYSSGTTPTTGAQVVYKLSSPQTYQLTPQEVELLLGTNNLWTDCGDSTVEYGIPPYYNPTEFDAKPLIKVTGTGTLGIGEYILTITGTASQTLYIDCETMEIYKLEGTVPTGASSLVSINKTDFPVLKPGHNGVSVGTGLSALTITPRWWRI